MTHQPARPRRRSARSRRRSIIPQSGLPLTIYFHPVRVGSETAKKNILKLFFREGSTAEHFAKLYKRAEDAPETRLLVKLGVCWKLSASSPETWERTLALPHALKSLCMCLCDVVKGENPITKAQKDYTSQLKRQIMAITALPDFVRLTPEALYRKFLDVFVPEGFFTRQKELDPLSPMSSCSTRKEAGMHLNRSFTESWSCYADGREYSDRFREAGSLVTECLNFCHENMYVYWIGKALRKTANKSASNTRVPRFRRTRILR